jgi:oxalate decarboxylase/phosphoglucose isomerase-like protein (cupin superfamily)
MRLPHWHPNASELSYVKIGKVRNYIWLSPGETAVFTVSEGMCWFIPQGALHSLESCIINYRDLVRLSFDYRT